MQGKENRRTIQIKHSDSIGYRRESGRKHLQVKKTNRQKGPDNQTRQDTEGKERDGY